MKSKKTYQKMAVKHLVRDFLSLNLVVLVVLSCATPPPASPPRRGLTQVADIRAFEAQKVSEQALEVISNNDYSLEFFEKAFSKVVSNLDENKNEKNADLIWSYLCEPLIESAYVPPDVVKRTWNRHFSYSFVSLPKVGKLYTHCSELSKIKSSILKEYRQKEKGFEICNWEKPAEPYKKAMQVYNVIWAYCNPPR